jgi:hypothetical protein
MVLFLRKPCVDVRTLSISPPENFLSTNFVPPTWLWTVGSALKNFQRRKNAPLELLFFGCPFQNHLICNGADKYCLTPESAPGAWFQNAKIPKTSMLHFFVY